LPSQTTRADRWRRRPLAGLAVRAVILLLPFAMSLAAVIILGRTVPRPHGATVVLWYAGICAFSWGLLWLAQRLLTRLLPLAALLEMALVFPDQAPSRTQLARRAGSNRELRQLLDAREENAPFKVEKVREDRYFVFFFDKPEDPGVLFDQLSQARAAVRQFIREDMKPTDYVAIAGHDVRLKVWSDFTTDKAKLERALDESSRFGKGELKAAPGDGPSILRNVDSASMERRTGSVYQALDVLAEAVRPIRARKNLVMFSPGIVDIDETVRGGMIMNRSRYLDPALESLNASNVSVYSLQLQRPPDTEVNTTPFFHQRLTELADATGGQYFMPAATFRNAVNKVEQTNSGYYLVTYRSRKERGEQGFQKVDVSVKNPEFKVVARSGYAFGS